MGLAEARVAPGLVGAGRRPGPAAGGDRKGGCPGWEKAAARVRGAWDLDRSCWLPTRPAGNESLPSRGEPLAGSRRHGGREMAACVLAPGGVRPVLLVGPGVTRCAAGVQGGGAGRFVRGRVWGRGGRDCPALPRAPGRFPGRRVTGVFTPLVLRGRQPLGRLCHSAGNREPPQLLGKRSISCGPPSRGALTFPGALEGRAGAEQPRTGWRARSALAGPASLGSDSEKERASPADVAWRAEPAASVYSWVKCPQVVRCWNDPAGGRRLALP